MNPERHRRDRNLRQLLLGASRRVHHDIVVALNQCGYPELRPAHTTLLTNLDLDGDSATSLALKAGITKQAMGRIARELEHLGYVQLVTDPHDARSNRIELSDAGEKLMHDSFRIIERLEEEYSAAITGTSLEDLKEALLAISEFKRV